MTRILGLRLLKEGLNIWCGVDGVEAVRRDIDCNIVVVRKHLAGFSDYLPTDSIVGTGTRRKPDMAMAQLKFFKVRGYLLTVDLSSVQNEIVTGSSHAIQHQCERSWLLHIPFTV